MSEWLDQMLTEPLPAPVCGAMRTSGTPPPPEPKTVVEMYDAKYEVIRSPKWREQLLDRPAHRRNTATDVAEMVLALEEDELSTMIAFPKTEGATDLYVSSTSGVWSQVLGSEAHEVVHALGVLTERLDMMVICGCKRLLRRLRAALAGTDAEAFSGVGPEAIGDAMREAEDHLRELVTLFERLRTPAFAAGVVKRLITARVMATRADGMKPSSLDTATGCIAFEDGVYCFEAGAMLGASAARERYQTMNVGYAYEDMMESEGDLEGAAAYESFMSQIFSASPEARAYVVDVLASSLLNENRQIIMFHFCLRGSNGKTTLFELVRTAFGALFIKCASTLLNPATITTPSAPNEELVSICGRRVVMVSEPSSQLKLSASAIKELTGGDEQSTRAIRGRKQTFVFNGTLHVMCNKIPESDDMDGGVARRLRCVPYGSTFVSDPKKVDAARHCFAMDTTVSKSFPRWRMHLMREVMAAARRRVAIMRAASAFAPVMLDDPPEVVMKATGELVEREDTIEAFVKSRMERTDSARDHVSLNIAWSEFKAYCALEGALAGKKKFFKSVAIPALGPLVEKSNGQSNFWRGWRVRAVPLEDEDEDEDDGGEEEDEGATAEPAL